jgi:CIC family chloride channel protein
MYRFFRKLPGTSPIPEALRPQLRTVERMRRRVTRLLGRIKVSENTFMVTVAVTIGFLSGLCNYAFRKLIDIVHLLVVVQGGNLLGIASAETGQARLLAVLFPMIGGLLLIPLWIWFGNDLKFGFSRFLAQVNLRGGKVPGRTILTRGLASAITIGSGGSAGQEGPIAQIGGAIGSETGQFLGMSGDRLKTMVACGVSGGVAATFNAPIAGVFFAQEIVLLSSFEMSSFTSIVIASGMSTVVSRALLGNTPAFAIPPYVVNSSWDYLLYVVLGVIIGILAAFFIKGHCGIRDRFAALPLHPLAKPLLGGLLVGVIAIGFPQVFGNGYEFMETVLHGNAPWLLLAALILAKALATSVTLGSGMPGGLFAPSLFIGAVTGGAFGHFARAVFPAFAASPGTYALIGMGAFLSAATHAPMTAIFLLFEITASYHVIIPIMITCVIGTTISRQLNRESLETEELKRAGIDLQAGKERNIMKSLKVGEVMTRTVEAIPESMTLRQFTQHLGETRTTNFPLVNAAGELTGILSVQDFMGAVFERALMDLVVVKELATLDVVTVTVDEDLDQAMQKIGLRNIEQLPVVDHADSKHLVGIVSRRDMISAYNRALMTRSLDESQHDFV